MYQNGNMWARNSYGKVPIAEGDMFVDKNQWSKRATEEFVVYTTTGTLVPNIQFRHNSRSHREDNVLELRRGKDKPRKPKVGDKRRVGRPRKVDENTSKKAKTTQSALSQRTIATPSTSQPKKPRTSSSQPTRPQPSSIRQTRSQTISSRKTISQTKQT
ncbi:hypothetical protein Cgig2_022209 [Carnegiea gigantea]|uniref:Uncharacterized protein n=1 Tax=Carnegiea gigantea TaxID=171969 RepID=A0A9Q1QFI5_9CARY|nr:hypothetical protein Cgig2_022209 [Carnegiea gigantea]